MAEERPVITEEQQRQMLELAKAAASAGDPKEMLVALYKSGALDGLARRLQGKWPRLDFDDVDYAIGQAVDVLYQDVSNGDQVANPVAFLWKVSDRRLCDRNRETKRERTFDPTDIDQIKVRTDDRKGSPEWRSEEAAEETDREERRARALMIARGLLPRLGQQNVQAVMAYVFDAIEAERHDLPIAEIAEALGLSADTVRTSRSRGFRRLKRIARDEGLGAQGLDTDDIRPSDDEDGEDGSAAEDTV